MVKNEMASLMSEKGTMYSWASKVNANQKLTQEETEISEVVDVWAKDLGTKGGVLEAQEIAQYIQKTVEPIVFNVDDSLLSSMFNMGTIGEFDEKETDSIPKNTLKVYDAVRGGNVPKSYLDPSVFTPVSVKLQTETELKFSDLRQNGYKSVAKITSLSEDALTTEKYFRVLNAVDNALAGGTTDQNITAGGNALTVAAMDSLSTYLTDRGTNPFLVGLTKYTNSIARMDGFEKYLSDNLKDENNKYGRIGFYSGVKVNGIPSAKKTGLGQTIVPDKRIIGIADKIGDLDMRGSLRVFSDLHNNSEKITFKFTGFDFDMVIYYLENMARITLS